LLFSQAGTFVGFSMIAGAHALWVIFAGRILDGLTAGNLSVAQAYIADNAEAKHRTRAFGIAFGIGFLLGPAVTAFLSRLGLSVPLYCAAGLSLTSMQSLASLASLSAAPISGWLIDHQHLTSWGWFAAVCCGMALLFCHWGSASRRWMPAAA
jgi:DHA1 family tetracycline resistance protein-like MFS transporter